MTELKTLISRARVKMLIELRDGRHRVLPQHVYHDTIEGIGIRATTLYGQTDSVQVCRLSYADESQRTIDSVLWSESDWYQRPVSERVKYLPQVNIGEYANYGDD